MISSRPFSGILATLVTCLLVLGAVVLSLAEGRLAIASQVTRTAEWPTEPNSTATPAPTSTPTRTETPTQSPTPACTPEAGWLPREVQPGETVDTLAQQAGLAPGDFAQASCLQDDALQPGMIVYLPPEPTATDTIAPATLSPTPGCGPRTGWVVYTVQRGDTLARIAAKFGISYPEIQEANCLGDTTLIHVGDRLAIPVQAESTPAPGSLP